MLVDAAVEVQPHGEQHVRHAGCRRARLLRVVQVADALDPVRPAAHVGGVGVLAGVGGDVLLLRAAWRRPRSCGAARRPAGRSPAAAAARPAACRPDRRPPAVLPLSLVDAEVGWRRGGDHPRSVWRAAAPACWPRHGRWRDARGRVWAAGRRTSFDGRAALSLWPPPRLLAWARKSALSGACWLATFTRVTSSVGRLGAGLDELEGDAEQQHAVQQQRKQQGGADRVGAIGAR